MRRIRLFSTILAVTTVLVLPVVGCGGSGGTGGFETITEGVLEPGDQVAVPNKPILEIDGDISTTNDDGRLLLDMASIEQLGLVRYSVDDPWLKREVEYTGVLLEDLVGLVQPTGAQGSLHLVALDDYEVDIPIADAERWPVLLATKLDGRRMAVANGGPTRIVFPYGLASDIDELKYKDLWIWNIKSISFR